MTKLEENKMVINEIRKMVKCDETDNYEDMITLQLTIIATTLSDISKSLAIIADKKESEYKAGIKRELQYDDQLYQKGYADGVVGWIPVSKRLPEEDETVIASTEDGVYTEAKYTEKYGWEWAYEAGADYWVKIPQVVTAWMPIPEKYEPESEVEDE